MLSLTSLLSSSTLHRMTSNHWTAADLPRLDGRTFVITGANSGIGLVRRPRARPRQGAHVVLAVRDVAKGERRPRAIDGDTDVRRLDLADLASVRDVRRRMTHGDDRRPDQQRRRDERPRAAHRRRLRAARSAPTTSATSRSRTCCCRGSGPRRRARLGRAPLRRRSASTTSTGSAATVADSRLRPVQARQPAVHVRAAAPPHGRRLRRQAVAAHPGWAATNLQSHSGRALENALMAVGNKLLAQDADMGALPTLYAATQDAARRQLRRPRRPRRDARLPGARRPQRRAPRTPTTAATPVGRSPRSSPASASRLDRRASAARSQAALTAPGGGRSVRRMATGTRDVESALIESVCERVRERVAPDEVAEAEAFVRSYYRRAPAADLDGREPVDLYGAALAHWTFGRDRPAGDARVRVYNPTFEQHGWQSPHTAIEIVSDDMPFLVDSVSMELSRRELGIHVLVHPVVGDESYMHIEVDRQADGLEELAEALRGVLAKVRAAVEDWQPMRERMHALVEELEQTPPAGVDPAEVEEARALLAWLERPPLHVPRLPRVRRCVDDSLHAVEGSGLGLLRGGSGRVSTGVREAAARRCGRSRCEPHPLVLSKANAPLADPPPELPRLRRRQALRRRAARWSASAASSASTRPPPTARCRPTSRCCAARSQAVRERAGFPRGSHDDKALVEVLDTLPARRAVPDRGRRAVRDRDRDPRARRAPARAAVHAHATATSASCPASCSCRAIASTRTTACASARSCARRSVRRPSTGSCG